MILSISSGGKIRKGRYNGMSITCFSASWDGFMMKDISWMQNSYKGKEFLNLHGFASSPPLGNILVHVIVILN